ncbi:MAG: hypothetical protein LKF75_01045 [Bacilli bacterium]|jgi:hypothetical protein|nr:hypothetical protein [Bacilli bacterium]MCH4228282.1 hypothetical protein [Bacilli bacterium]MCH4277716.1 hypothetical protein [Bacilli bacterium]MCI2054703.1 hypothetical protein [Bacilli bacterium]
MNKKTMLFAPLALLALASCSGGSSSSEAATSEEPAYQVKWVTPTGTPTLAFYNQGSNANWVSSSTPSTVVVPSFQTNNYDAIVFDGVSGLNVINKTGANYKLAKWISGGNFYVVSTTHTSTDSFATGETIMSFVQTGNASRSFLKLSKDVWNWNYADTDITYQTGVAGVAQSILQNGGNTDYYVVAEPVLTSLKSKLGDNLHVIYDLQSEWKKAYNQETIPAAALFINNDSYSAHKDSLDTFISDTQKRMDTAISTPSTIKASLDAYGNDAAVQNRFGFTSSLAVSLQSSNKNDFGLLKSGVITDNKAFANDFNVTLGGTAFSDSLFLE